MSYATAPARVLLLAAESHRAGQVQEHTLVVIAEVGQVVGKLDGIHVALRVALQAYVKPCLRGRQEVDRVNNRHGDNVFLGAEIERADAVDDLRRQRR